MLCLISISLFISDNNYGIIGGTVLTIATLGMALYFYANSLNKIIVEKDYLILKKNWGQITIPKSDITAIAKMNYSNFTMTYGSKGVFGYIGSTMDDSYSLVKDRKNMVRISTEKIRYLVSAEEPEKLIAEIKSSYNLL